MDRSNWYHDRVGRFTASEIYRLLYDGKGRQTYINEKFEEWKTGEPKPFFTNEAMEWGNFYEPFAAERLKVIYKDLKYYGVEDSEFFPYGEYAGASPDGIIKNILVEFKCPFNENVHQLYKTWDWEGLKSGKKNYYAQMQFNMHVLDLDSGLFVSYDPRIEDLNIIHVPKDNEYIKLIINSLEVSVNILKTKIHDFITG